MTAKPSRRCALLCAALVVAAAAAPGHARAQTGAQGVPNALQGFSQNRGKPVQIEAATLEIRDKDKAATFTGDVRVQQGDTQMRCKTLVVFYDQNGAASSLKAAAPGPGGSQQIRRLEARGGVVVTQKDQTVTGETGMFDMKANTVTLNGGVVMTQGKNVLRGDRLVVDLTSGAARVESGKAGQGRVQGLFQSTGGSPLDPVPAAPAAPQPAGKPLRIN
ncbi:MAG: LPS ABC transporter substrate-binding protein LptA [Xanthobacteraceae bacterium]|nr:MAG: LPS ABC transporter substrate-binding protein LptA [Xanthobacteraceae bacterium]